jgi:uncharacterized membrane protein YbhN (UPF0104 family)
MRHDDPPGRGRSAAFPAIRAGRRPRVFSAPPGQPRFRRATDALVLAPSAIALAALTAGYPPGPFERSLDRFLDSFPVWLDPLWILFYDALALWAVALVLALAVSRRIAATAQLVASVVAGAIIAMVSARLALGHWPDSVDAVLLRTDDAGFPVLRVAASAVVILAVAPYLVRPLERTGRWILLLGIVGAVLAESAPPSASLAAFLVAVVAVTVVRLAFGTSAGHPEVDDVVASLRDLGVAVGRLDPASRQPAGVFVARGTDDEGRELLVKVYGRDAYDTQLLAKLWRSLWYQGFGLRVRLSRLDAVEHEGFVTLLARQAGVPTREVVVAGESSSGDALLVLRGAARPLGELSDTELDVALLASAWHSLGLLGKAGIAHHQIDPSTIVAIGDRIGVVDFEHGALAAAPDRLQTDRAQLLATTAALAGAEAAIRAAIDAVGADGVAELIPYLQPAAFDARLRAALDAAGIDPDDLRSAAAEAVAVEPPELIRIRRVTWWSLAQIALLAFAVSTVVGALSGIDYDELGALLQDASWGWVAVGLLAAQLPRITQSVTTLGSVPAQLPFVPVYVLQLATSYMNLALPSNLARMAVNIRFFQRQGIPPATAVTAGAIDSFAGTAVQAVLLVLLLLFSEADLDLDLDLPSGPSVTSLVVVVSLAAACLVSLVLVGRARRAIVDRVRRWWPDVREALRALRTSHKLARLVGGSLATEILFAAALGVFANALGFDISLAELLLINISVSLLASFLPVPGGIGVAEFGLTVGLVAAGMPEEAALATALLYRVATFYLPPVWGFFAMRWLQRNALL